MSAHSEPVRTWPSRPVFLLGLLALVPILWWGCTDGSVIPDEPGLARLALAVSLPANVQEQARAIDAWRVMVIRPGQGVVAEESDTVSPDETSVTVAVSVSLEAPCERLRVRIELLSAGEVWYLSEREHDICTGVGRGNQIPSVQLEWVGPLIGLTPSQLTFSADQATNPSSQTFTITNTGGGTLSWSASGTAAWLAASPASGSLGPGASQSVSATVSSATLDPGQFQGNVVVTGPNAGNSPQSVSVSLTVIEVANSVLQGTVSAEGTGIGNVSVSLSGKQTAVATTGASGGFAFTGLTSGSYTVTISNLPANVTFPSTTQSVSLGVNQTRTVDFQGTYIRYVLAVTKGGTGSGTVTSSPEGIDCGATCEAGFVVGTVVTLTATPSPGSMFAGWSGDCAGTVSTCQVTMSQARSVTATFTQVYALSVTKSGTGAGTVTSSPAGIQCGTTCSASFPSGTVVTLTATPVGGSLFTGWSGACTGANSTCQVTMSQAQSVTATFSAVSMFTLTVTRLGDGSGIVTSSPAGISCGRTCSASFPSGSVVTLTATASDGSVFAYWDPWAICPTEGNVCRLTMTQDLRVSATFWIYGEFGPPWAESESRPGDKHHLNDSRGDVSTPLQSPRGSVLRAKGDPGPFSTVVPFPERY